MYPEDGRQIATKMGAAYYETSVYNMFGVEELFENVLRAALISKRSHHFWMALGNLRTVRSLSMQAPYCVPRPKPPPLDDSCLTPPETFDMSLAFGNSEFVDVAFNVGRRSIGAHCACLAVGSKTFRDILTRIFYGDVDVDQPADGNDNFDISVPTNYQVTKLLRHQVFHSVARSKTDSTAPPIVMVDRNFSFLSFNAVLQYVYSGNIPTGLSTDEYADIHHLAELLEMTDLTRAIANHSSNEGFLNIEIYKQYVQESRQQIKQLLLTDKLFSGLTFIFTTIDIRICNLN